MRATIAICCLSTASMCFAADRRDSDLKSLYQAHQWFRLRDAVEATKAPAFYRGAVACAFHDVQQAERHLQYVIKSAPQSEQAYEARELLVYLRWRTGRFRQVLLQLDELLKAKPDAADIRNSRPLFAALSQYPEQSVTERHSSTIRYSMKDGNLFIPVSINGRSANYMLDTGANFSSVSESETERLGLVVHAGVGTKVGDSTGAGVVLQKTAVADQLRVGNVCLRHVAFLVLPDQRFTDIPPSERGAVGLQVLLALQTVRWSTDGTLQFAFRPARKNLRRSNLCFDGAMPVIEVAFRQSRLNFVLDTGAVKTDLFPKFREEFASQVDESGKKGMRRVTGAGGSAELDAIILPELTFRLAGLDAVLRPAPVLLQEVGSRWHHGILGLDLLNQARAVTIDFKSMTLALE